MSEFLTLDQIVAADDIKEQEGEVPERGGKILLREMTAGARDWFEGSLIADAEGAMVTTKDRAGTALSMDLYRVKLVAASMVHPETKKRIFVGTEAVEALAEKSSTALVKVADIALRLNDMSPDDVKSLGEDLRRAHEDNSTSDSRKNLDSQSENSNEGSQDKK